MKSSFSSAARFIRRLSAIIAAAVVVSYGEQANAQVDTKQVNPVTTISSEELNKLPSNKRDLSKLVMTKPATDSAVVLSNGTPGFSAQLRTPTGLDTIIFTTPKNETVEVYLPHRLSRDSTFTGSMKVTVVPANSKVFADRKSFKTAAPTLNTINFEGIAASKSVATFSSPLTLEGVTFNGSSNSSNGPENSAAISVVDSGFFDPLFQFKSGAVLSGFAFIEVTLPPGVTAVGTDIMTSNPSGQSFEVVLSTGESFSVNTPLGPKRGFFGVTSDEAISSIRFTVIRGTRGGGVPVIDNFSFGLAQGSPNQAH